MGAVLINCSRRKRFPVSPGLSAASLAFGSLDHVVDQWVDRVGSAQLVADARTLYCGRAFAEAVSAASSIDARLLVVSAGLGVVQASRPLPAYDLTVSRGSESNVLGRVAGETEPREWWRTLTSADGFTDVHRALGQVDTGLLLVALPSSYLSMVERDLQTLPDRLKARLRIFTSPSFSFGSEDLQQSVMPYDGRLDGSHSPRPGTGVDFAARALHDFVEAILPATAEADRDEHREKVAARLEAWTTRTATMRQRRSDDELLEIIRREWDAAGTSASRMLRRLRDDLHVACEQRRLAILYQRVGDEREGSQ